MEGVVRVEYFGRGGEDRGGWAVVVAVCVCGVSVWFLRVGARDPRGLPPTALRATQPAQPVSPTSHLDDCTDLRVLVHLLPLSRGPPGSIT